MSAVASRTPSCAMKIEKVKEHIGAIVTGLLMKLDAERMTHALGIAGSLCSGLVEFSRSGGMVKRLHVGRAAESGALAATLVVERESGTPAAKVYGIGDAHASIILRGAPSRRRAPCPIRGPAR